MAGAAVGTIALVAGTVALTVTGVAPTVLGALAVTSKVGFGIDIAFGALNIATGLSRTTLVGEKLSYSESGSRILKGAGEVVSGIIGYSKSNILSGFASQGKQIVDEAMNAQTKPTDSNPEGYNADNWNIKLMKQGDTVWGGEPNQTNYYTTNEVAKSVGTDATKLYQGLQVAPGGPENNYREFFTQWQFNQDSLVGTSKALANPQYGIGGFNQYYVSDFKNVLGKVTSITMTNR